MNKALKIAVILSAVDNMSATVKTAFNNMQNNFLKGGAMLSAGIGLGQTLENFTEDFKTMEDAAINAKIAMMGPGGVLDSNKLQEITTYAAMLADKYGNTTANYLDMFRVFKNNRLTEDDVMGGAGMAAAGFAELFRTTPIEAAAFASKMKNDMKVAVEEMPQMMDMVARLHGAGIGKTGSEAIYELTEFYAKTALEAPSLGIHGLKDAQELGILGSLMMTKGLSGQTTGTNFSRIFNALQSSEKVGEMQQIAASFGKDIQFGAAGSVHSVEALVNELKKLQDLNPDQINKIMTPLGGLEGMDARMLKYLGKFGEEYDLLKARYLDQADMHLKVEESLKSLSMHQIRATRNWENTRAILAEKTGLTDSLKKYYNISRDIANGLSDWVKKHETMATVLMGITEGLAGFLILAGGYRMLMAIGRFMFLDGVMKALSVSIMTKTMPAMVAMQGQWIKTLGVLGLIILAYQAIQKLDEAFFANGDSTFLQQQKNKDWGVSDLDRIIAKQDSTFKPNAFFENGKLDTAKYNQWKGSDFGNYSIQVSPVTNVYGNMTDEQIKLQEDSILRATRNAMEKIKSDNSRRNFN